ncbi:MAG TPA: hypothetical protein VG228_05830 [Solirubrobacteraceae bacterium]|jgi:hypothetical protein|nr:hypothetical protein [Solirubrobacteraceae bacterium]
MPNYVFTYRQAKGASLNMDETDSWFKWFDEIGEHITERGSAVASSRQVGNVGGDQSVSGFTVISARDMDHAVELAHGCPAIALGHGLEVGELLVIPAAA